MAERPEPLKHLDRYFAAATIAHEYIADLHLELARRNRDNDRTRDLLHEAANLVVTQMPELTGGLRRLGQVWDEQQLLDPPQAKKTLEIFEAELTELEPELSVLRRRQTKSPRSSVSSSTKRAAAERGQRALRRAAAASS